MKTLLIIDKSKLDEVFWQEKQVLDNPDKYHPNDVLQATLIYGANESILKHSIEITLPSEQEIEKMAKEEYPLEDARKVLLHDNSGQYSRRKAYVKAFKACIELLKQKK